MTRPTIPLHEVSVGVPWARSRSGVALTSLPPLTLYVHFPWCVRKCPYCDFNSHEVQDAQVETRYLDALRADLEAALPSVWGRQVQAVFIGGGTPSLLSEAGLDRLLQDVRSLLPLVPDAEITLEANPGTAEAARFRSYRQSGVNRLSIGVQSFSDRHLERLGRIHTATQAWAAIEMAKAAFDRVNLDLMYALPDQSLAECEADVRAAIGCDPGHLSVYHLTIEPHTVFAKYPPSVPDEDVAADMQAAVEALLAEAGYAQYEVSAYAKQGQQCKHNRNYWQFGDYLGIGAGAHGKLSFADRIVREVRYRDPGSYMDHALAGSAIAQTNEVDRSSLPFEFMLNALRLREGVDNGLFESRTGLSIADVQVPLRQAIERGLLDSNPHRLMATDFGWRFLNELMTGFLADSNQIEAEVFRSGVDCC